ncbi:MAG: hypothetical protein EBR28_11720, partial [Planctomycetia bacterium]|nr:hypothetical protein [Planctomycetia bacterium]
INASTTVNVTASATASTLTLIGANARMNVLGTSLTAAGLNLTGSSGENVYIFMDAGTLNLGGGTGSLTTTGGITSWLTLNNGTSTLNLGSSTLSYFWLASSGAAATTTIGSGTYTNAVTILGSANGSVATLNVNGGSFNAGTLDLNYANATSTSTMNLNGGTLTAQTIRRNFDGTAATFNWNNGTIANKSGVDLNLNRGASATQNLIVSLSGTGTHTFSADSGRTITVQSTATLADKAGQNGTLEKSGSGTLKFAGANTFSGATTLSAGTLNLADQNAIQNSTLTMNGGSVVFDSSVSGSAFTVGGLSAPSAGVGYDIALQNNAGTPGAITLTVGGNNSSTTYAGVLSAAGGLTKSGSGVLTLTGANTFSGATTVSSGTLQIGNGGTAGAIGSTSAVSVASGATLAFNRSDNYGGNFTRAITGSGGVVLSSGTLRLATASPSLAGDITVNAGVLQAGGGNTLGSPSTAGRRITIAPGATLTFVNHDTFGNWAATPAATLVINGTVNSSGGWVNALGAVNLNGGTLAATDGYFNNFYTAYVFSSGYDITVGGSTASLISVGGANNPRIGMRGAVTFNVGDATGDANPDLTAAAVLSNHPDSTVGGLTKSGLGTMALSGSNVYTGTTTVNAGVLQIGVGGTTGWLGSTASIAVASGATLAFNRSDDYGGSFAKQISGSGGVLLSSGSLTLQNNTNSFTGGATVNGGVLKATSGSIVTANSIVVNNGGTLGMAQSDTWGGAPTLTTAAVTINAGGNLRSDGYFNSLRNLTLAGGTVTLNGGLGPSTGAFGFGGTVTVNGTTQSLITAISGSANLIRLGRETVVGDATVFNVTDAAGRLLVNADLTNNFGTATAALTKSGPGTLVLAGSNSYTAATSVTGGALQIGNGGTTGSIASATGITIASGATLAFNRSDAYGGTLTNTISGSGTVAVNTGTLTLNASGNNGYSSNLGVTVQNGAMVIMGHTDMFSGTNWNATTSPAFTVNAGGVLASSNNYNTLWNLNLNGGTLRANGGDNAAAQAFALAGTVTVGGSTAAMIESGTSGNGLNAFNISGNGNNTVTFNVADVTGNSNADLIVTAGLQNNLGLLSNLTKSGAGTMVLSGSQAYTGATTVSAGTLQIGNAGTSGLLRSTSGIAVSSGATLAFNRTDSYGGSFDRVVSGSGGIVVSNGVLALTGANTYTGTTTVSSGTLQIGGGGTSGAIASNSVIALVGGATLAFNRTDNYGGNFSNRISGTGTVAVNSGTLTLSGSPFYSNPTSSYSNSAAFTVNSGATVVLKNPDMFGSANWDATTSPVFTVAAGGTLASSDFAYNTLWNLNLNGGTLLSNGGANANAQAFGLAGTVNVGGATASLIQSGTVGNGYNAVNISGSGNTTLTINVADVTGDANADLTVTASLQNNRAVLSNLSKSGAGTMVITGSNAYTGATTVSAGRLQIGSGGTSGAIGPTSGIALASGATLAFNRTDAYGGSFDRVVSGTGGIVIANGVLALTGANTYTGATTVSGGTLQIGGGGTSGAVGSTSGIAVAGGATLAFNRTDNYGGNFSRQITGSGGIVLSSGSLTLSNNTNGFTGGAIVNGGVLKATNGAIVAANSIVVNNGGTLGMAQTDTWGGAPTTSTAAVTINAGGNLTSDGYFNSLRNLTLAGGTV